MADDLTTFKENLRSVLISEKGGIHISRLNGEYRDLCGDNIKYNYRQYPTLESYLQTLPDTCYFRRIGGDTYVHANTSEKQKSIQKLINQQKSVKKKKPARRPLTARNQSSMPTRVYAGRFNSSFSGSRSTSRPSNGNSRPYQNQYSKTYNTNSTSNSNVFDARKTTSTYNYNSNNSRPVDKPKREYNSVYSSNYKKEYNNDRTSTTTAPKPNLNATIISSTSKTSRLFDVRALNGDIKVINQVPNVDDKPKNTKYDNYEKEEQTASSSLDDSSDYKQELREFAKQNNLGDVRYTSSQLIQKRKVCGYYSKCIVNNSDYISFPDYYNTPEEADNVVSKKALDDLKNKIMFKKYETIMENEDELTSKIKKLFIKDEDDAKFSTFIEEQFQNEYAQKLSSNWLDLLEDSGEFELNRIKAGKQVITTVALKRPVIVKKVDTKSNGHIESTNGYSDKSATSRDSSSEIEPQDDNQELPETLELRMEEDWDVLVLRPTNAREVVLRLINNTNKLDDLVASLQKYYNIDKCGKKVKNVIINKVYAAVFDDAVFRVQAVQLEGCQVYCWFLDDGIVEKIQKTNLYELSNRFLKLSFQAFSVGLDGLDDQSENLIRRFVDNKMRENDDSLCLYARPCKSDPLTVRLFDTSNAEQDIDVNEEILNFIQGTIDQHKLPGSSKSIPKAVLPKLLDGKEYEVLDVVVSLPANPHHFVVRDSSHFLPESEFMKLNRNMQKFYEKAEEHIELNETMIFPGLYVCVKEEKEWCRARVEDLTFSNGPNSKCTCYLVDLGKIVVTDIDNIQPLYSAYIDFPMIAIRATLNEILPTDDDWAINQVVYFKELVDKQEFKAYVNDIIFIDNEPFLHLNLRDKVDNDDISDILIKDKMARSL